MIDEALPEGEAKVKAVRQMFDTITRSPSGKPDYRWAKATAVSALEA